MTTKMFCWQGIRLKYSIIFSLTILVAEIIGGLLSNSLALLSDAGHVFADIIALGLSWYGVRQAMRPSNSRMTFGYHRIGVIVAIVNAVTIFVIAAIILYEAYNRFQQPPEVKSVLMMIYRLCRFGGQYLGHLVVEESPAEQYQYSQRLLACRWGCSGICRGDYRRCDHPVDRAILGRPPGQCPDQPDYSLCRLEYFPGRLPRYSGSYSPRCGYY